MSVGSDRRLKALADVLEDIARTIGKERSRGGVATYIPALAKADAGMFGISIATANGEVASAGDKDTGFSIQSISKVFALTAALGKLGGQIWHRVGKEPSGTSFNSISQLEIDRGIPRNPFVNAGALVVADCLLDGSIPRETVGLLLRFIRHAADDDAIFIDKDVADSERENSEVNAALANYLKAHGNLNNAVSRVLDVHCRHSAITMSCRQLAAAGRYLAFGGTTGQGEPRLVSSECARRINALLLTCGLYNGSGDFAFRVGIPAKSGVGGGILAIVPGKASVAAWCPGLDRQGNSLLGIKALELLARQMDWSVFGTTGHAESRMDGVAAGARSR